MEFDKITELENKMKIDKITKLENKMESDKITELENKMESDKITELENKMEVDKITKLENKMEVDKIIEFENKTESDKITKLENQLADCIAKNTKVQQSIEELNEKRLKTAKKKYFSSLAEREVSEHTVKSFLLQKENLQNDLDKLKDNIDKHKKEDRIKFREFTENIADFNFKHDCLSYRKQRVERESLCKELRRELEAEEAKFEKMQLEKAEAVKKVKAEKLEEMQSSLQTELSSLESTIHNNQNALETLEIKLRDIKDRQSKDKEVLSLQKVLKELR